MATCLENVNKDFIVFIILKKNLNNNSYNNIIILFGNYVPLLLPFDLQQGRKIIRNVIV